MASLGSILLLLLPLSGSLGISSSRKMELRTKETKYDSVLQPNYSFLSTGIDPSKVIQLSWHPRAFLYKGFLSDDECDHLISLAQGKLKKSDSGNSTLSNIFTGNAMRLTRGQGRYVGNPVYYVQISGEDEVISKIEERISAWTFLPKANGEDMQILHYGTNESYQPHFDYHDKSKSGHGGHRIATVLMYLSNVNQGGETIFPQSELKDAQSKDSTWSGCAATGYAAKPVKGNALLFFNLHPDATPDESSLHGGCKVLAGEKWTATKWIHVRGFDPSKPSSLASDGECTDEDNNCPNWAAMGECHKNPVYMLGSPDYYGTCRKSCGAC